MSLGYRSSVGVVGGGILGLAVARELTISYPDIAVTVFEKEDQVATHQSGHNSGVVHAGVYYKPGSLKAELCRHGAELLREFCEQHSVRYRQLGKLIVARNDSELSQLAEIEERAIRNAVPGIKRLSRQEIADVEPAAVGVAALHSPKTAAVDYQEVARALARGVQDAGGQLQLGTCVTSLSDRSAYVEVITGAQRHRFAQVIVCAGLWSDRLARAVGSEGDLRIVPFRGEYFALRPQARDRVRGMIYPVPDPRYPFLGVHLTRDVANAVHVGPNAVLALALEGYRFRDIDLADLARIAGWPGSWRLAARHWRHGLTELASSLSKRAYLAQVRRYVPSLELADLVRAPAGVRAQAVDRRGGLIDDFVLQDAGHVFLVRNAPSPAATSSLALAQRIVARAIRTSR